MKRVAVAVTLLGYAAGILGVPFVVFAPSVVAFVAGVGVGIVLFAREVQR